VTTGGFGVPAFLVSRKGASFKTIYLLKGSTEIDVDASTTIAQLKVAAKAILPLAG